MDFIPDLSGALYVPDFAALLVADLHLEKGSSLARRGVHLPPYDTRQSLRQLQVVIGNVKPRRLIFLGDSFHDGAARERIDESDLAGLRAITAACETIWITVSVLRRARQLSWILLSLLIYFVFFNKKTPPFQA